LTRLSLWQFAPMLAGQLWQAQLAPTSHTTGRAPILPGRLSAPILPGQLLDARLAPTFPTTGRAPISPDQLLNARLELDALRLTFHQSVAATPSVSGWSMRSRESVRLRTSRRHGFPRSHGPAAAEIADQRLRFRQPPRAWHPGGASPWGGHSARPQRRRSTGGRWGKPWHDDPWAAEVAALVTGPTHAPGGPTGSGETP